MSNNPGFSATPKLLPLEEPSDAIKAADAAQKAWERQDDERLAQERADAEAAEAAATAPAPVLPFNETSGAKEATENKDFNACLQALCALFEVQDIEDKHFLADMKLMESHDETQDEPRHVVIETAGCLMKVAKGLVECQVESGKLTAQQALASAALAKADMASYPDGLNLTGSPRDRYLLTLAADALGFGAKITNRPDMNAIPDDVKEQWSALAAQLDLGDQLSPQDRADIQAGQDNLQSVLNEPVDLEQAAKPAANAPNFRHSDGYKHNSFTVNIPTPKVA